MLQTSERSSQIESVRSTLNYIVPGDEKPVTKSNLPGEVRVTSNSGNYQAHSVTIRNGRLVKGLSLDKEGFVFVQHETKMKDFYNDAEVKTIYYPEIEQLVKQSTGATRVLVFDHTLRAENDAVREEKFASRPVRSVHNDYTEWSGPQRVRDLLPQQEAEALIRKRFSVIQVWRPVRNPVVSAPLAIADSQSIAAQDLVGTERRYPDRVGEIYHLAYNPGHRWFYFPDMQTNEAIVFKCYDSMQDGRARWSAHAAFDDPNSLPNAPARESIEMRTLAFFDA
ncbi:MAG TPA: CmcJ/NvfI family oxidoreductase [Candidatus Binatus sp.]|nr:CmcJ/NvfI family oxidoreductase [Candidatus Binatus sp.]